jgi:hypothetical protein
MPTANVETICGVGRGSEVVPVGVGFGIIKRVRDEPTGMDKIVLFAAVVTIG